MTLRYLITITPLLAISLPAFGDAPSTIREFLDGHRATFSTKGHPKAKGVNLTIAYPNRWKAAEGEHPNIVQKFVSDSGLEMVMIKTMELPLPPGTLLTKQDQAELFAPSELREWLLPPGATFVSAESTAIEGEPAGILEYTMRNDRVGTSCFLHAWTLNFLQGKTVVSVTCAVGGPAGSEGDVARRMAAYKPLFTLIANSILFPDKWSAPPKGYAPLSRSGGVPALSFDDPATLILTLLVSFVITWSVGLTPPLLIRYIVLGRPLSRMSASWIAAGFSAFFWFAFLLLHEALGLKPGKPTVWIIMFFVARWIMSRGYTSPAPGLPKAVPGEGRKQPLEWTRRTERTS